jgi:hypothetical protein
MLAWPGGQLKVWKHIASITFKPDSSGLQHIRKLSTPADCGLHDLFSASVSAPARIDVVIYYLQEAHIYQAGFRGGNGGNFRKNNPKIIQK